MLVNVSKQTYFALFCLLTTLFVLTGCAADIDRTVTFYHDEAWEADMEFDLLEESVALADTTPEELEADMVETVAAWEEAGARVSWETRRDDALLIYAFHIEGVGISLLNEIVFEGKASITIEEIDGRRQIHFSDRVSGIYLEANNNTLTLQGGKVISSNGNELNAETVQWVNPGGTLEAVLTEKSRFGVVHILVIVILMAVVAGVGYYFWRQGKSTEPHLEQTQASFCIGCGKPLNPEAKFCPYCGQKQA